MSRHAVFSDSDSEEDFVCSPRSRNKHFSSKSFTPQTSTSSHVEDYGWGDDEDWTAPSVSERPVDKLVNAIASKDVKLATELFQENRIKINATLQDGWTLLLKAAKVACVPLINMFIQAGADTGQSTPDGHTCLMAVTYGRNNLTDSIEAAKMMLEKDANVNACDIHGTTPLMLAVTERRAELALIYLDAGARIDQQNNSGKTALFMAAELGYGREVRLLLSRKANPRLESRDHPSFEPANSGEVEYQEVYDLIFLSDTTKWIPGLDPALKEEPCDRPVCPAYQDLRQAESREMERSQIEMTLDRLGLGAYTSKFALHDLMYTDFIRLTEKDLIEIGIGLQGRLKILNTIGELQKRDWSNAKALPVNLQKSISSAEGVCLLNSIDQQMRLISKCVENLGSSIRRNPQGLECGIEVVSIKAVVKRIDNIEVGVSLLTNELQTLEKSMFSIDKTIRARTSFSSTLNGSKSLLYNKWTGCVFAIVIGGLLFFQTNRRHIVPEHFMST